MIHPTIATKAHPIVEPAADARASLGISLPTIDLVEPDQVCRRLQITPGRLLELVNCGEIPAFDLDGAVRLRAIDVATWYANTHLVA